MKNIIVYLAVVISFSSCNNQENANSNKAVTSPNLMNSKLGGAQNVSFLIAEYYHSVGILQIEEMKQYESVFQLRISSYHDNDIMATISKKGTCFSIEVNKFPPEGLSLGNAIDNKKLDFIELKRNLTINEWDSISNSIKQLRPILDSLPKIKAGDLSHETWDLSVRENDQLSYFSSYKTNNNLTNLFNYVFNLVDSSLCRSRP